MFICYITFNMQNFSKLYRQIKTQSSERGSFPGPKYKIKVELVQKSSDLNLSNVAINGNKLYLNNSNISLNKTTCMHNSAIKSFTSFNIHKKSICKLRKGQYLPRRLGQDYPMNQTDNFLSSSFQIGKIQQILKSSLSLKKNNRTKLNNKQQQLQQKKNIKSFSKYRNNVIKSKVKISSNLLQDNFIENIDLHVGLSSNNDLRKMSLCTNSKLNQQYRKLQEIKKIVKKIQEKNQQLGKQIQRSNQSIIDKQKTKYIDFRNIKSKRSIRFSSKVANSQKKTTSELDINNLQPWQFD